MTEDVPSTDRLVAYYDTRAARYESEHSRGWSAQSPFRSALLRAYSDAHAAIGVDGALVDVGVGAGRVTLDLLSEVKARPVIGIDRSPGMLAQLMTKSAGRVSALRGNAHRLPLRSSSVAVLHAVSVIQYLDLQDFAAEAARVLMPGGSAIVAFVATHPDDTDNWRDYAFQRMSRPYLARFRKAAEVVSVLGEQGLTFVSGRTIRYARLFSDLMVDRRGNSESRSASEGIAVLRDAPEEKRVLYGINNTGFYQYYAVLHFSCTES